MTTLFNRMIPDSVDRSLIITIIMAHLTVILASNYLVTVSLTLPILGLVKASMFTFPLIYVITDLTVRLLGKDLAANTILWAFVPAVLLTPVLNTVLGLDPTTALRIGIAAGVCYMVTTIMDANLFHWFREHISIWWIAPALAAIISITVDTYAFFAMAFHGGADPYMAVNWHIVASTHIFTKWLVSLAVLLPLYGLFLGFLAKKLGRPDIEK